MDELAIEALQRLADSLGDEESISKEEALRRINKFAQESARNWVYSLSDEEAAELVEKHDLAGRVHHLRKVHILQYRKAIQRERNTEGVNSANQMLKWLEDNRY